MTSNGVTIQVEDLVKVYDSGAAAVRALNGIDLTVRQGEVVMLMGPSGSGKTTLLSIMGCILRPTSGRVMVCGQDITPLSERHLPAIRLRHIGFIFQGFNLFPTLTACENVELALDLKGIRGKEARRRASQILETVGLGEKLNTYPADLSGGQKQRVAIARALGGDPDIVLADEPTAALDSQTGKHIMEMLRNLTRADGKAVVIVTHDNRILEYADRILQIEDGRIANGKVNR